MSNEEDIELDNNNDIEVSQNQSSNEEQNLNIKDFDKMYSSEELLDETNIFDTEENSLQEPETELSDEILEPEEVEEELEPPESEKARMLNTGNIFIFIVVLVAVFLLIIMIAGNKKRKQKEEINELDKVGYKTEIEFNKKEKLNVFESPADAHSGDLQSDSKEINQIVNSLPDEYQIQPARNYNNPYKNTYNASGYVGSAPTGVQSVGGSDNPNGTEKPDSRNSKSLRNIEGLKGMEGNDTRSNTDRIADVMTGKSYPTSNPQSQYPNTSYPGNTNQPKDYQAQKQSFYNANQNVAAGSGEYLSENCLFDGTVISAVLQTAINTDNPGMVMARVTENVYSSYDHKYLLIPEGSTLLATYNSSVSYGQNTVQVAWNLLIRPDGYRIQLGNMNGVDKQGASGYKGSVSNHPWETLKAMGIVAVYSIIQTEVSQQIKSATNEYLENAMTDVYSQASQIGNKIVDKALDIQPTIKVKEGTSIKIITNTPLVLPPVEVPQVTRPYVRTSK